jgi:hypothetical protein
VGGITDLFPKWLKKIRAGNEERDSRPPRFQHDLDPVFADFYTKGNYVGMYSKTEKLRKNQALDDG